MMRPSFFVVFVFHFKHDGDNLVTLTIGFAENVIAFRAVSHFVVFFEIRPRESHRANFVELAFAVLLKRFPYHLRGKAQLHFLHARNFLAGLLHQHVFCSKLGLHVVSKRNFVLFCLRCLQL